MTSILTLPARSVAWLEDALQVAREFPVAARSRLACELISLRRSGLSPAWERVRGVSGAASLTVRAVPRSTATLYRIICATSIPQAFLIVHAIAQESTRADARLPRRDARFARARMLDATFDIQERRPADTARVQQRPVSDNAFVQLGFADQQAAELLQKAEMIAELRQVLRRYGVDQATPHANATTRAVIFGDIDSVSLDNLRALAASLSNDGA